MIRYILTLCILLPGLVGTAAAGPVLKPVWYPERDKLKAVRELPAAVYLQPAASASGAQQ